MVDQLASRRRLSNIVDLRRVFECAFNYLADHDDRDDRDALMRVAMTYTPDLAEEYEEHFRQRYGEVTERQQVEQEQRESR